MRSFRRIWSRVALTCLILSLGVALAQSPQITQPEDRSQKPGKIEPSKKGENGTTPGTKTDAENQSILQPGEYPIDLGSALRLAGVENPELLLARSRVSEAVALRQLAAAQLLPNVNLGTNYDQHNGPLQQSSGNILTVNRNALYFGLGTNAIAAGSVNIPGLSYNLNIGEAWFGFLVARQRQITRQAETTAVRNDVLLRVVSAYLDLLRGDARRAVAAKNREEAAELARITTVYALRGQGRQADADRAAVELKARDIVLAQAEADTLTATAKLAELLNLDPSTRFRPIDGWAVPAPIVPDPVPLPDLLAIALMQRPELAAKRSEVQSAIYELSLAKMLPFSPNVILGFSSGGFGGGSNLISSPAGFIAGNGVRQSGPRFGDFDARSDLDVVVYWTFRNLGIGNRAMMRAADSRVQQMRLRELITVNRVRREVAQAKARVDARLLQVDASEKAVRISTQAFREDLTRIKGGQGLPLEAVDSMRLLGRSRLEYLDTIIEYNRAQVELWVALGQPPANTLARPVPQELVPPPIIEVQPGPRILQIPQILASPLPVKP